MKIGFFDSGLGGITVFKEVLKQSVNAEYIYLADNKNTPYGVKDKNEVKKYVYNNINYLVDSGCDIIVIACNTATALCIKELRETFKEVCFIGIEPAVKLAIDDKMKKRVLVTATTITLKEDKLKKLISDLHVTDKVDFLALDKLVMFAENNFSKEKVENYLKEKLLEYNLKEYSHIVLGCTHFPLFRNEFKKVAPELKIIDGSIGIANNFKKKINNINLKDTPLTISLVVTKKDDKFIDNFKTLLKQNINFVNCI